MSISQLRTLWLSTSIGVLCGLLVSPVGVAALSAGLAYYDELRPVVRMSGQLVDADHEQVVLRISGDKLRSCQYLSIAGYWRMRDGTLRDANERRIDQEQAGDTKPVGRYDIGEWRLWPREAGSVAAVCYVSHNCGGRLIVSKIADVELFR